MLRRCASAAVIGLALAGPASADVWDGLDEDATTANQLAHGAEQLHDLAARGAVPVADQDWFRVSVPAYSSFEVVVDGVASNLGSDSGQFLTMVHSDGSQFEVSTPLLPGKAGRSLAVENATNADFVGKYALVRSQGCASDCGPEAVYAIRGYDTTCAIPRFNNSATQVTVVALQNAGGPSLAPAATGHLWFWSETGVLLASQDFSLGRWQLLLLNTSTLPGLAGAKGSITVSYKGAYGQLAGKAVALEPATGFTFDTPLVPRPR